MTVDKKLVSNDPSQEKIKFVLQLFNSNKLIEAKKEIDKQLDAYPKSPVLFNILGAVFAGQNKLQEALTSYNKSIKINPNYVQAYNNLGACMYKLGKITEAIKSYEKAINIAPDLDYLLGTFIFNKNHFSTLKLDFSFQGPKVTKTSLVCKIHGSHVTKLAWVPINFYHGGLLQVTVSSLHHISFLVSYILIIFLLHENNHILLLLDDI